MLRWFFECKATIQAKLPRKASNWPTIREKGKPGFGSAETEFASSSQVAFPAMAAPEVLKFMPFNSSVDVGFWFELAKKKLDVLKLDERELPAIGFFGLATSADPPARFNLEASSFNDDFQYVFLCTWAIALDLELI